MKVAWKQVPLPDSLQIVPGWSHFLLLCLAATSGKLHVLASHRLSLGDAMWDDATLHAQIASYLFLYAAVAQL